MSALEIWCEGEGQNVPVGELLYDSKGALFNPKIHTLPRPHYCSTGQRINNGKIIEPSAIPGVLAHIEEVAKQSRLDLDDSVKPAQSWGDLIQRVRSKLE